MKMKAFLVFVSFVFLFSYQTGHAIEIDGGKMEDVVVAPSGYSEGKVVTKFSGGYSPWGPDNFDVDKDGNVYILDWLGAKVEKYDKQGKWIRTFRAGKGAGLHEDPLPIYDIAVDNHGNIHLIGYLVPGVPKGIFKFSPEGRLLWQLPSKFALETGDLGYAIQHSVSTDKSGRVYNFEKEHVPNVVIYSSEGKFKGTVGTGRSEYRYIDQGMVQKEVGDDIYFRCSKYLLRTSLEEYVRAKKTDTVAVLPDWSRLVDWRVFLGYDYTRQMIADWAERAFSFIGFDRNDYFYFNYFEDWYSQRSRPMCLIHRIFRFRLAKHELKEAGEIKIYFQRGKEECSDKELYGFRKRFIVSGDGTIYFLHGTVDTVKVSKIIMDEPQSDP